MKLLTRLALLTLFLVGMALPAAAQYTTVTINSGVQDSTGIIYVNGKYNVTLVNSTGQVPYFQGTPLPTSLQSYGGTLTTSGTVSGLIIPATTSILSGQGGPVSQMTWNFSFTASNGVSGGFSVSTAITGSTQDISATVNAASPRLIFPITNPPLGPSGTGLLANPPGFSYGSPVGSGSTLAGNQNAVYASPQCPTPYVSGNCYPVKADWQWAFDGTSNTAATSCGSATVTAGTCISLTANDPHFSCGGASFPCTTGGDNGKNIFGTGDPFDGGVVFTQSTLPTIVQVIDTTHAQASAAATASVAGTAVILWGSDDTANLQAADNARYYNASMCGTLYLPQGGMMTTVGLFNLPTSPAKCGELGATTIGVGEANTILIAPPNFNYGSCTGGGGNNCFLWSPGATNGKTIARDFTIWGGGNNRSGQNDGTINLVSLTFGEGFQVFGWAAQDTGNVVGISIIVAGAFMVDGSASDGAGATGCSVQAVGARITGSFCGENSGKSLVVSGATTTLTAEGNIFGPGCEGSACTDVQVTNGATMTSFADVTANPHVAGSNDYAVGGGSGTSTLNVISITANATTATDVPIGVLSGGVLSAFKMIVNPPASGVGLQVNSGGSYYDDCGENTITNSGTYLINGNTYGDCSITGANAVAGNLAASAGWGSTAAFTAVTGTPKLVQFTLTNSGTGQAASPTITYTFPAGAPTGFTIPPICNATQVGGNNPLVATANFTPTTITKTSALFTYNGTPTVSDTEIVQISCHVQ